jgi:hypothetical protein
MSKKILIAVPGFCLLFAACNNMLTGGSTETSSKVASMLYNPGGSPAAYATVRFCLHDYNPRSDSGAIDSTTTDTNGNYAVRLDAGTYTITANSDSGMAYRDSIAAKGGVTVHPPVCTLKTPGTLQGVVQLQPGDDARTVFILFLGTNFYTTPDDAAGNFTTEPMSGGKYRVRILTTIPDYQVMDTSFTITAGSDSVMADTIRLKYAGIPMPKNLAVSYDTLHQTVVVSWDMPDTSLLSGYNVYRSIKGQNFSLVTQTPLPKTQTVYYDTGLTVGTVYEYRVVSRTQAGVESKMVDYLADTALIVSASMVTTTFSWSSVNTIHDTASINDTVKVIVSYSNPTRKIDSVEWHLDTAQLPRHTKIDSSLSGKDTLTYYCPAQAGVRQLIVKAVDAGNTTWRDTFKLWVILDAPKANAGNDTTISINDSFTIHGSGNDRFGRIVKYRLDANDDGTFEDRSTTPIVKRLKASSIPGDYNVVLQVEDDDGNKTNDTMVVHVLLDPPVANAGNDTTVLINSQITLHGSARQEFGTIVKWEWNINNSGFVRTSTGDTTITTPDSDISVYPCILRVTDDDGNIGKDTVNLQVLAWSALGTGMNKGVTVTALAIDSSGNLYAGGRFTTAGGVAANNIAKWNGSSWSALGTGTNGRIFSLSFDGDSNLYAGGQFTTAGGVTANNIAKWNGSSWSALGTGTYDTVRALAVDSSGNLYAGGEFTSVGGTGANYIAKWNGTAWSALGSGMNGRTFSLSFDGSGNLYAGGYFTIAGGGIANYIAKYK